jgi:hypothetical protein
VIAYSSERIASRLMQVVKNEDIHRYTDQYLDQGRTKNTGHIGYKKWLIIWLNVTPVVALLQKRKDVLPPHHQ